MNGIDISHHQGNINLAAVPADFVICKASQGKTYVDDKFTTYMQQLSKLGKLCGAYHYANGSGVGAEADHFVEVIKPYLGNIIIAIDWENNKDKNGKDDNPKFAAGDYKYCEQLLVAVEKKTGITPFLYMSKSVARQFKWEIGRQFPFWCAQYKNHNLTGYQENPWTDSKGFGAWSGCQILQYSSKGRLQGYANDLDLDKAYITAEQWLLYAQGNYKEPVLNARPTLKKGDKNEYVLAWQYYLNLLGYNLVPDGIFGIKTEDAVKDYQSKRGLKPDGIIGPLTWNTVGK